MKIKLENNKLILIIIKYSNLYIYIAKNYSYIKLVYLLPVSTKSHHKSYVIKMN